MQRQNGGKQPMGLAEKSGRNPGWKNAASEASGEENGKKGKKEEKTKTKIIIIIVNEIRN